jgi:Fur family ferric uptake transcriptional regulator
MSSSPTLRLTRQRAIILEELAKLRSHPSADELYALVRQRLPRVSLGTIYRNLMLLAEQGKIRRLDGAGTQRRFDGTVEEHHHVRCVACGRVDDLQGQPTVVTDQAFGQESGYLLLGYRLDFYGRCPECRRLDGPAEAREDELDLTKQTEVTSG